MKIYTKYKIAHSKKNLRKRIDIFFTLFAFFDCVHMGKKLKDSEKPQSFTKFPIV
ncbi:hypothetical protein pah_c050o087 [Parachlamydia acanthamoebae str. Hall's coccus]|nr:hypothetical protein pah_c050o087 [Parachlamydia acanthamoebae str. Hall's coccus]